MRTQEYRQHYVTVDEATCKKELTKLKAEPGYEWLRECDSTSLQAVTEFLQKAFEDHVFHNIKGKVKFLASELEEGERNILGASVLAWEVKEYSLFVE